MDSSYKYQILQFRLMCWLSSVAWYSIVHGKCGNKNAYCSLAFVFYRTSLLWNVLEGFFAVSWFMLYYGFCISVYYNQCMVLSLLVTDWVLRPCIYVYIRKLNCVWVQIDVSLYNRLNMGYKQNNQNRFTPHTGIFKP